MILSLCLLLSAPGLAGRRADQAATEAQLRDLNSAIVQMSATTTALTTAYADQQEAIRVLQSRVTQDEALLLEAQTTLLELDRQMDALIATLSAPPPKKGKVDPRILALETDVLALHAELDALRKTLSEAPPAPATPPRPSAADEEAARKLLDDATAAVNAGDYARAKPLLAQLLGSYPETSAGRSAIRMNKEVAVVGKSVTDLDVTHWFTKPAKLDDAPLTLLLFWEVWCPHCKREVPASARWVEQYGGKGMQIIALTKLTKSATPESVKAFIKDNRLPFPVAQEGGALSEQLAISGIPAAALVRDGVVVWRGHPARLTPQIVEQYLPGAAP